MHPDRIEVVSPGGLPAGISEDEYLEDKVSILRNPILGNVLYRVRVIERFGTGVTRIREAYSGCAAKPRFEVFENSIAVTLPLAKKQPELPADELAVYYALDGVIGRPSSQIAERAGFGRTKTVKLLGALTEKGYAEVSGTGRGTLYRRNRR